MNIEFDVDKIVEYLDKYKNDLPKLYNWNANIERLVELDIITKKQFVDFNKLSPYEKELKLKKVVGEKLRETHKSRMKLFDELCLWIIKDWGGIRSPDDEDTLALVKDYLNQDKPQFKRIASTSKVGSYMYPNTNIIYDSRVAYSLNWIILSTDAGRQYFPIPEGRNSKMIAFDVNVLIRLKNISAYHTNNIKDLDNKKYINNCDKRIYIKKSDAYFELKELVKQINKKLWKGDIEKENNLYYTEMLLYSIADREVFMEIVSQYGNKEK